MAKFLKWLGVLFFILYVLYLIGSFSPEKKNTDQNTNEVPQLEVSKDDTGVIVKWHWYDYDLHQYAISFMIPYTDLVQANHNRLYEISPSPIYPDEIDYSSLIRSGGIDFMDNVIQELQQIAVDNNFTYEQLANVTVAMVQNIPYTLLHQMSHEKILEMAKEQHIEFLISYHQDPVNNPYERDWYGGCRDSVEPAGVYTPAEFICTMKGDCDTRTLFLFTLMKKMGYDVAILNGPGHSMLGCNLVPDNPASPYLSNYTSRYYFWETTVFYNQNGMVGPRLGEILDPKFNAGEWKIVQN